MNFLKRVFYFILAVIVCTAIRLVVGNGIDALFDLFSSSPAPSYTAASSSGNSGSCPTGESVYKLTSRAQSGDTDAMIVLGWKYETGTGAPLDYAMAMQWYQKAADSGAPYGLNQIGDLYYYGYGVTRDYAKALTYYREAVSKGDVEALCNMGYMYEAGLGSITQNYSKALDYYQRAADQGSRLGMQYIGQLYLNGRDVPKDAAQAQLWFDKAKDAGYTE